MDKRTTRKKIQIYDLYFRVIMVLSLIVTIIINIMMIDFIKDKKNEQLDNINKQISSQKNLLDQGMRLMFNSIYLEKSWIEDILSKDNIDSIDSSLLNCIDYDPELNVSSLILKDKEEAEEFGNIIIQGKIEDKSIDTLKEISKIKEIFKLQRFLKENSFFDVWSTYYSDNSYLLIYPYEQTKDIIKDEKELFHIINESIVQLNSLEDKQVYTDGWESDIFFDHAEKGIMFSKNSPIVRMDKVVGTISENISIRNIKDYVNKLDEDIDTYVLDSGGQLVYNNGSDIVDILNAKDVFNQKYQLENKAFDEILEFSSTQKRNNRYYFISNLDNAKWNIIYSVSARKIEGNILNTIFLIFIMNVLFISLTFFILRLLKKYKEKSIEIDIQKNEFLMTVSHDLKTPLSLILGFSEMIMKKVESVILPRLDLCDPEVERTKERIKRNSDIIEKEGKRLTRLIDNLLDLSRLGYGNVELDLEPAKVDELVNESIEALVPLIKDKKLKIYKSLNLEIPEILVDREKIIQVLVNLISNAVKFTDKGYIKCSVEQNKHMLVFSVEDTGVGIPEEHIKAVFNKFISIDNGMGIKGTGLGLAICKSIVGKHGGEIWLESKEGDGSIFCFTVPIYLQ